MVGQISVSLVNDDDQWDAFLNTCPAATIFHSSDWIRVSGREVRRLGVFYHSSLIAGCTVEPEVSNTHAFAPYRGPLLSSNCPTNVSWSLVSELLERQLREFSNRFFFTSPWMNDFRAFIWGGWTVELRYTYLLKRQQVSGDFLPPNKKLRSDIGFAAKMGLQIHDAAAYSDDWIDTLLKLSKHSFQRSGSRVVYDVLEARSCVSKFALDGSFKGYFAVDSNDSINAVVGIFSKYGKAHYLIGGRTSDCIRGAMGMLLVEAIRDTFLKGDTYFDFEGSHVQTIDKFFRSFGGSLSPFYELRFND